MRTRFFAIALLALATAGSAQTTFGSGRHQLIASGADGWNWYLVKDSTRLLMSSPMKVYRFWITGENPGLQSPRYGMVEVKLACGADRGWFVTTHTTLYNVNRRIVRDTLTGDDPANWVVTTAGNPMDAARRWVCR